MFGDSLVLQTNKWKEFKNNLSANFPKTRNISRIYSKPRHPQIIGQIERCNQTIKSLLANLSIENSGLITRLIDFYAKAVSIYNKTMYRAHEHIAFKVFFKDHQKTMVFCRTLIRCRKFLKWRIHYTNNCLKSTR